MSYGLRIWDAAGGLVLDETMRLGQVLGVVTTDESAGSITNDALLLGTPFAIVTPLGELLLLTYVIELPEPTFSGNTMSWPAADSSASIVYGIY